MKRWFGDRQLTQVHKRLQKARQRLASAENELAMLAEQSDEDSLRSMVSDSGLDRSEATESNKHTAAARREVESLRSQVAQLQRELDDLLDRR